MVLKNKINSCLCAGVEYKVCLACKIIDRREFIPHTYVLFQIIMYSFNPAKIIIFNKTHIPTHRPIYQKCAVFLQLFVCSISSFFFFFLVSDFFISLQSTLSVLLHFTLSLFPLQPMLRSIIASLCQVPTINLQMIKQIIEPCFFFPYKGITFFTGDGFLNPDDEFQSQNGLALPWIKAIIKISI